MKKFRITTVVTGTIKAKTLKEAVVIATDMTIYDILDSTAVTIGDYTVDDPRDPHGDAYNI